MQIILNTDEEIYGGQGLIDRDQYAQRTISRRFVMMFCEFLHSIGVCKTLSCDKNLFLTMLNVAF